MKKEFTYPKFPKKLRNLLRELAHKKKPNEIYYEDWRLRWNRAVYFLNRQK